MSTGTAIAIGLIAILVGANLVISISLVRSRFYSPVQKLAQGAIVWLVPIFGVIGIWAFLRSQHNWEKYDTHAFPDPSQKAVAVEVESAIHGDSGGAGASE